METVDLVPGLRAAEYNAVNSQVARLSGSNKDVWYGFVSAWSALVYRLRAARKHAAAFSASVALSSGPPPEERYRQETDLFVFATSALSAVECFFFAAYCIGACGRPSAFPIVQPTDLQNVSPVSVRDRFATAFPNDSLTAVMQRRLEASEYQTVSDVRNVVSHRGIPIRQHSLSAGGPDRPSTIPSNLKDLASDWRYDRALTASMLDPYLAWLENTVNELVVETARFVDSLPGAGARP